MKCPFGRNKTKQAKSTIDNMAEQLDIDGLGNALMDQDEQIREYAADAIERIGPPEEPAAKIWYFVTKRKFDEVQTSAQIPF